MDSTSLSVRLQVSCSLHILTQSSLSQTSVRLSVSLSVMSRQCFSETIRSKDFKFCIDTQFICWQNFLLLRRLGYSIFHFAHDSWYLSVSDQLSLVCQFTMRGRFPEQRLQIIKFYYENSLSVQNVFRALRPFSDQFLTSALWAKILKICHKVEYCRYRTETSCIW